MGKGRGWRKGLGKPILKPEEILIKGQRAKRKREHSDLLERAMLASGCEYRCTGLEERGVTCEITNVWNMDVLKLQIDHRDGDPTNNLAENLRFLCPNCHSQTPTYGHSREGQTIRKERKEFEQFLEEIP